MKRSIDRESSGEREPPVNILLPWPELIPGVLERRYKRFLADVTLGTGETVTAHCPNSGRMTGCSLPGRPVYISRQNSPKRKLRYTWEIIDMPSSLVGINTQVPNRLVFHAAQAGIIPALSGYETIRREVRAGNHTRFDLALYRERGKTCFVEIKNSTLVENDTACFPDAVTTRGKNHLVELRKLVEAGSRAVMFFLVQRMDATRFMPADHIDPAYGKELRRAAEAGVEMVAYDVHIDLAAIRLRHRLPVILF